MKRQVLDEIIVNDDVYRQLEKGEKIIWEGRPRYRLKINPFRGVDSMGGFVSNLLGVILYLFIILLFVGFISGASLTAQIFWLSVVFIVVFGSRGLKFLKSKKTKYIITNERIIFRLWKIDDSFFQKSNFEDHSISFSKIKNIVIVKENPPEGIIFLVVKNPQKIIFDTYSFSDGERRHQPTLEMIEDVEEVGKYIQMGIQNKL